MSIKDPVIKFNIPFEEERDLSFSKPSLFISHFGTPVHKYVFSNVVFYNNKNLINGFIDDLIFFLKDNFNYSFDPVVNVYSSSLDTKEYSGRDGVFIDKENQILLYLRVFKDKENNFNSFKICLYSKSKRSKIISFFMENSDYKVNNPKIHLLCEEHNSLYTQNFAIKNIEDLDLQSNYNDDLIEHDNAIKKFISLNESGLVIFSGLPGTGKTFYIRSLIKWIHFNKTDIKKVIYIPANMADKLASPNFLPFLTREIGSVIIIEDAERIVQSREYFPNGSGAVADLLNLTEGILGDAFKLKVFLSFNMDIEKVDEALLRKGRLRVKYEFKKLTLDKTNALLKKLNKDGVATESKTLSDIYNWQEKSYLNKKVERPSIGFGVK